MQADFFTQLTPTVQSQTSLDAIIERIQDGKVVPIVGGMFVNDLAFRSHDALVRGWAGYIKYALADQQHELARMAQYASVHQASSGRRDDVRVKEEYLKFLKAALQLLAQHDDKLSTQVRDEVANQERELTVSQIARRFGYPSLASPQENPLLFLAALPLPVYITTSCHDFLEVALREKAGKEPQTEVCRWHDGLRSIPSVFERNKDYEPRPEKPLVYHLHGFDAYPQSLVLTEDDYLDFLTNIFRYDYVVHPRVNQALTESSLALIGYRLRDWDFRALFRGVINPRPSTYKMTRIAIQLEQDKTEQEYLDKYLRQVDFEVEWKAPGDFIAELYQRWS